MTPVETQSEIRGVAPLPPPPRRGDELGIFHLGSTAIVLFAHGDLEFEALEPGMPIRMGQAITRRRSQK